MDGIGSVNVGVAVAGTRRLGGWLMGIPPGNHERSADSGSYRGSSRHILQVCSL